MTSTRVGPSWTTGGAATIGPASASPPAERVIGTPFSIAVVAAASSASHEGGGDPALAIGTRRPRSSWKTTQRSASVADRSEEHTSELQSRSDLVCRLLLEKKKKNQYLLHRIQPLSRHALQLVLWF